MIIQIKITTSENAAYYGVPVNTVIDEDFERYISAVVASEIGNAPIEACKAQAVASRTFAYRYILKNKPISDNSSTAQAFRIKRYSDSYKTCIAAAEATAGLVLFYNGIPIDAFFSNSNGGMTISSQKVFGSARDYLISKPDPWDAATHVTKSGHGVGMSQVGAKYAAQHGVAFKDILAFYYPGTTLTTIKKEESTNMISLSKFLNGCKRNAARIKGYKLGCNGSNGLSDCIGYIMGALQLEGQAWNGTHGSNYAARYRTKNLHRVDNASQLKLGEIVYKYNAPGTKAWKESFPIGTYKNHPDQNDYYHVGVVTSVNPLEISHCSGGGMHYDKKLGDWAYSGNCSLVEYGSVIPPVNPVEDDTSKTEVTGPCKAVVDVPDDSTVNIRSKASTSGSILVKLKEGTHVDVLSVSGSWAKIGYSFNKTGTGYVMKKFINNGAIDVPNDTTVNVRVKATTNSSIITTIPEGSKINVLTSSGEWSKIEYSVPKSGTGYVMKKYLRKE